uniref:Uncharacterized protein n=1 Tax=Solanum lycopersicum TaxID=4081 RepID=A0A3Q7ESI9_SOLLC
MTENSSDSQLSKFKLVFRTWENLALLANVRVFGGSLEPFYFSTTLMGYTRFILSFVISLWHYSCGMVLKKFLGRIIVTAPCLPIKLQNQAINGCKLEVAPDCTYWEKNDKKEEDGERK